MKPDSKREDVGKEKNTALPSVLQGMDRRKEPLILFQIWTFYSCSEVMVAQWIDTFLQVSESVSCSDIWSSPSP